MAESRRVDVAALQRVLMEHEGTPGVFEQVLGVRPATASGYKAVHLMNDLAQCALGGAPSHGGDFLARVVRQDVEGEGNEEPALRKDRHFGAAFGRAFPEDLGRDLVRALRVAAKEVLTYDKGVYQPGTSMCSPLATHRDLLGFEQFRRFGVGRLLADVLPPEGLERLRGLLVQEGDPVTRAFRPLLLSAPLVDKSKRKSGAARSDFDRRLGEGLTTLLGHPLSKPALLRALALGGCLGVVLKILGVGRAGGTPALLALANVEEKGAKPLREEAVMAFARAVDRLDAACAKALPTHPNAKDLLAKPPPKALVLEVADRADLADLAPALLAAARVAAARVAKDEEKIYWPDRFAVHLGRKIGCVLPLTDKAGWGKHLALTPELVEVLILMMVPSRGAPIPWTRFWAAVREGLGVVVGANPTADAGFLAEAGVDNVSGEALGDNAEALLTHSVRRGVALRLPDGEAEVGGELA